MPWPARQNRHLPATQAHTTAWARAMGFFDEGNVAGWTQARYERAEFPLFLALVYPDATGPQLDAVTDFYVWSFFFDDLFFRTFTPHGDVEGARAFVARLPAFMPLDGAPSAAEPQNAVERALLDVWTRIAPTMSALWTQRFGRDIQEMNESWLWELANATEQRVPDPIDYVEMRRRTGGVFWAADLVEYTLGIEVPAPIYRTRPIRVLNEIFCDTVLLRNDILSYEKEMQEGETNNSVLVAEEFLRCDVQRAVDVINDVVTARLQQAEHTMIAEVAPLLDEHRLDPRQRLEVAAYVQGLRDAMAGDFQWETGTGRYRTGDPPQWLPAESPIAGWIPDGPSGLGTVAARIGADPRMLRLRARSQAPSRPPSWQPPDGGEPPQARLHPGLSALRAHLRGWAREQELLDVGGWGIWDAQRFDAIDLALLVASAHPDAAEADLELIGEWHVWACYFDDAFAELFKRRRELAGARVLVSRLPAFMPADGDRDGDGDGSSLVAANPIERALADVWSRSVRAMSAIVRARLREDVLLFARSWLWEVECQLQQRVPEPVDYVAMRRETSRAAFAADLVRHALRVELEPQQLDARPLSALLAAFADASGLRNDVVSYGRETHVERAADNGVLVVQRFLDCEIDLAGEIVARLAAVRAEELQRIRVRELSGCPDATRYATGLQDWLAGAAGWALATGRYAASDARVRGVPAGLGTSAARPR
jgi:germacradienol/geosmin synthase